MLAKKESTRGNRRGYIAAAIAVACILGGAGLIGMSIASQQRAPGPRAAHGAFKTVVGMLLADSDSWLQAPIESPQQSENPIQKPNGPTLPRSKPITLDIPAIAVHSSVNPVGQTSSGALEVPAPGPHYNEAAWYRHSPTPGSLGPSIVLGHVDSAADGPSVFFRLGELRRGDHVTITRADGSIAVFIVDEVDRYAKDDFPTQLVYSDIDHAGLRIVTCGGAFDDSSGHYLDNIVVFASLVGS